MSSKPTFVLFVIFTVTILLNACGVDATPTPAPTATTAAALPNGSSIKVGLVTDSAGVNDQAFNQLAWQGIQQAATDMGFQVKLLESRQSADYEANIDALATESYNVIITVGSPMGDATALKAKQYPAIKFAIIDHAYADSTLPNLTSLMFAEDQVGFLAGVLAGGMSKSDFVCSIASVKTPQSERYMTSFFEGATWQAGTSIRFMNNYINVETTDENVPTSNDSTQGKETALKLINSGCDVVFGIGGSAVNGALLAAKENNLLAVAADVDPYNTAPEVQSALITSALKNVDVAVYNYLKTVADGSFKAGIGTGTLQNGGVGLAPFHDWESKIPAELKAQIQEASEGIKDGSITIDLP
ncbi:MAG: BMP family ABC transporter substrate-binding protein [Caldilineaceae bacterium]